MDEASSCPHYRAHHFWLIVTFNFSYAWCVQISNLWVLTRTTPRKAALVNTMPVAQRQSLPHIRKAYFDAGEVVSVRELVNLARQLLWHEFIRIQ
jgi:hypothetical protein